MFLFKLTMIGMTVAAVTTATRGLQPASGATAPKLEGSWIITSVHKSGKPDPGQIGEKMVFTAKEVKFVPKADTTITKSVHLG